MIRTLSQMLLVSAGAAMLASIAFAQANPPRTDQTDDAAAALGQKAGVGPQPGTPPNAAASTRAFLGLGSEPDAAAAKRGVPAYAQNCASCHGPDARGGIGPSLVYSSQVLADDHGEKLVPFLRVGRMDKGMPPFATLGDATLKDISEFLHLQVENYANRGTYQNTNNVMTGDPKRGAAYFRANCTQCHSAERDLKGVAGRYRPLDLQRNMIFPAREEHPSRSLTAKVTAPTESADGRLTVLDDFTVAVVGQDGTTRAFRRSPDVKVEVHDPLEWHRAFAFRLKDRDMTDLVTYLGTLK